MQRFDEFSTRTDGRTGAPARAIEIPILAASGLPMASTILAETLVLGEKGSRTPF
jgi:hypothetical protein